MEKILKEKFEVMINNHDLGFYGHREFLDRLVDFLAENGNSEIAASILNDMEHVLSSLVNRSICRVITDSDIY